MATFQYWNKLMARIRYYNKVRASLDDMDSDIDDIIRPVGMKRRQFRGKKDILRRLEAEIEELSEQAFILKEKDK